MEASQFSLPQKQTETEFRLIRQCLWQQDKEIKALREELAIQKATLTQEIKDLTDALLVVLNIQRGR